MAHMTGRERLQAIYAGRVPDRPAVKLWGLSPTQTLPHPDYQPVYDAAMELTDVVATRGGGFNLYVGRRDDLVSYDQRPSESPEWIEQIATFQTPGGPLTSVFWQSTCGKPGYQREYLLKEPADIERLLSMAYDPIPLDLSHYQDLDRQIGNRGIVMFGIDHAMYGLQRQIGSENFALWSLECPDLLMQAIAIFAQRIRDHVKAVLASGLRPVFAWVGPELCIPPLMSPANFERYVFEVDQPLIELMHDAGAQVWVHCHGKMKQMIGRFVDMGVDVLNPIEPPPMGDVTLSEAFELVGDRMGLEGNIETHDLLTAEPNLLRQKIAAAIEAGAGRRFILCPCSGYSEDVRPSARFIENLLLYVREGVRMANAAGKPMASASR